MSACAHHLDNDPNGLRCLLVDHPEHPNGHQYASRSVSDAHDVSEAAAETSRG